MLSAVLNDLANPELVARFQRWCGVEQVQVEETTTTTTNNNTTTTAGYGDQSAMQSTVKDSHGVSVTRLQQQPQSSATAESDHRQHHCHYPGSDHYHPYAPEPDHYQNNNNNNNGNDNVGDDVKSVGCGDAATAGGGVAVSDVEMANCVLAKRSAVANGAAANAGVVVHRKNVAVVANGAAANGAVLSTGLKANGAGVCNGDAVANGTVYSLETAASSLPPPQAPTHTDDDGIHSHTVHKQSPTTTHPSTPAPPTLTHRGGAKQFPDSYNNANGTPSPVTTTTRVMIRYPLLYYWAKVGATLGNEEFYLTGMPYLLWTVDSAMIRQTAVLWWLVMYVGQAAKDYLGWPRPPCPPVIRLETTHLAEFSMPSTHAMAGTAIPLLVSTLVLERYELPAVPVLCVAFLWCATTCLSRLYLGVHTVLDVACGVLIALILYAFFSPLIYRYDHYQQTHPLAPLVLLLTSLALCTVCYPSNSKNSAKGDAIIITAVVVGVGIGVWLNYFLGLSVETPKPYRMLVAAPTLSWFGTSLLQFVVGVAVVFALKSAVKWATVRFFCFFFGLDRLDTQHPSVMVGYKYTTYLCLGLAIAFLDPLLFSALGFGRPNYYREVV